MIPLDTLTGRPTAVVYDLTAPRIVLEVITAERRVTVVAYGVLATELWQALGRAKQAGAAVTLICSGTLDTTGTRLFLVGYSLTGEAPVRSA
jgi:hypothetical protein